MNTKALLKRGKDNKSLLSRRMTKVAKLLKKTPTKLLKQVNESVWAEVDCLECANCCKTMTPTFTKAEVKKIAAHFQISYKQYYEKYLSYDEKDKDIINKSTPCQHLMKDNKCEIYPIRPKDCSGFPHFVRKDFHYQVEQKTYQNNIPRCPATLLFVEKLTATVLEK